MTKPGHGTSSKRRSRRAWSRTKCSWSSSRPVPDSIGTLWEDGKLSVADEHRASSVAARLISRLGARFARRGHRRGTVAIAAAPGDLHVLPVAIAANLLRWRGFDVVELGADTPAEALAETATGEPDLVAVGIACTTTQLSPSGPPGDRRAAPVRPARACPARRGRHSRCRSRPPTGRRRVHRWACRRGRAFCRGHRRAQVLELTAVLPVENMMSGGSDS